MNEPTRDEELQQIRKDYPLAYPITLALLVVIILLIAGMALYADHDAWGYGINVFTSVVSTVATVLILDRLAERRADRKAEEALKQQLVDDAASNSNEIAKNAVYQLYRKRWLRFEEGLLKGANLQFANLQGADFQFANLQRTDLSYANLQKADFTQADLRGANLVMANLRGATLLHTNLAGANLTMANLREVGREQDYFVPIRFDSMTILPDGTKWTQETDIRRFVDPEHPNFWKGYSMGGKQNN